MLDKLYTPNNTENLETKYLRMDDNFSILSADRGSVSLTQGANVITFTEGIGTTDYMVMRNVFDENNIPVAHVISNKLETGFTINVGFSNCTLLFNIIKL